MAAIVDDGFMRATLSEKEKGDGAGCVIIEGRESSRKIAEHGSIMRPLIN